MKWALDVPSLDNDTQCQQLSTCGRPHRRRHGIVVRPVQRGPWCSLYRLNVSRARGCAQCHRLARLLASQHRLSLWTHLQFKTSLCWASFVGAQHDTTRICCWARAHTALRAPAGTAPAARPQLSIDVSCPQGAQQQTRRPLLMLSIDGTDRQTTGARQLNRPCSACYAGSVNNRLKTRVNICTTINVPLRGCVLTVSFVKINVKWSEVLWRVSNYVDKTRGALCTKDSSSVGSWRPLSSSG